MSRSIRIALLALCSLYPAATYPAGLQVDVQQARAVGMGTAMAANVDDASSILYNPAGLARGLGLDIQLGDTLISPSVKYLDSATGQDAVNNFGLVPPPHFYASYGVTRDLTVGFGEFTLYGNALDYPTDPGWPGRFLITHSELQTFDLNPSVAYAFGKRVRVGIGFDAVRATVDLQQNLNFIDSEGHVEISGATWGYGYNAGVQLEPIERRLFFGISYRSTVDLDFDGRAHFTNIPPEFAGQAYDQGGHASLKLPQALWLAVGGRPCESLLLEVDATYTGWQTFHDISLVFDDPANDQTELKLWHHAWTLHLGGEYEVNEAWHLRAGVIYDQTPSPQDTLGPDLPDSTRVNLSAGIGYRFLGAWSVDLAYMNVIFLQTSSSLPYLPGDYHANANLFSATVGFKL